MSGKYALIIANTEYTDPGLAKLSAPGKDAEEFARVLKSPDIAAFDDVVSLINESEHIAREAIDIFFSVRKPDDLLVFYFSGHGIRDEYGSLYLAVKNTNRNLLRSTGLRSNFIREAMDHSRSKRQVLILDCCNSGAFAQGTKAEVGGSVGTASAFEGTGYGRIVLTASDSTQFAWEGEKIIGATTNSLFTHFLVKGLEGEADRDGDGSITVDELYDYTYEEIVSRTPKQTPGKWSYKQQGEIVLRQNIRIEDTKPLPLPDDLVEAINSSLPFVREGAVRQLEALLEGKNLGLARSARFALEKIAEKDDSRRVSLSAADILERIQQDETIAVERVVKEKAEQEAAENAAKEKAEREAAERETAEKAAKEKAEHEAAEKVAKEKAEREAAEKAAKEKAEREAAEKAAKEKAEREAAEKAALEKAEREAAEKAALEKAKREAAEKVLQEKKKREAAQKAAQERAARREAFARSLSTFVSFLRTPAFLKGVLVLGLAGILGIIVFIIWGVVPSPVFDVVYFTSNRDGKAEIYKLSGGQTTRLTVTSGAAESWSPSAASPDVVYFTSNRDGKAEIYKLSGGQTTRLTVTGGAAESWAPSAPGSDVVYFTSDRDGKAEIYKLSGGQTTRLTVTSGTTESWLLMLTQK